MRLGEVAGQQQLDLGLGLVVELLALAVLDHPAPQDVLDPVVVLVAPRGDMTFTDKQHQVGRHLVSVLVKQRLVGVVGLEGHFLVTQPQRQCGLQQRCQRTVLVDGQPDGSHAGVALSHHVPTTLATSLVDGGDIGEHPAGQ